MSDIKRILKEGMLEGAKLVLDGIHRSISDESKSNKEAEENNSSQDVKKNCTLNELIDFYFDMKKQYPSIAKCIVIVDNLSKYGINYNYKIRQFFALKDGSWLYADNEKKRIIGQIILSLCVDDEIKKHLGDKDRAEICI